MTAGKIGYPVQPRQEEGHEDPYHQPVIPPTLLWRFIGWLGGLSLSLDKAREMILKHDPNSTCHRVQGQCRSLQGTQRTSGWKGSKRLGNFC